MLEPYDITSWQWLNVFGNLWYNQFWQWLKVFGDLRHHQLGQWWKMLETYDITSWQWLNVFGNLWHNQFWPRLKVFGDLRHHRLWQWSNILETYDITSWQWLNVFGDLWRNQLCNGSKLSETCDITSYGSGRRKDVVNQCLEFAADIVHCQQREGWGWGWYGGCKLQALVYNILPSTTAVFSYAIGSWKLSANEQFFVGAQTVVSLLQTTQINQGVSFIAAKKVYTRSNKTTIVWMETELFFLPGVDASHVYVRALALGCFYSHISTRSTFRRAVPNKPYGFCGR